MSLPVQLCACCGEATGRCNEDSIYLPHRNPDWSDIGPLCEDCAEEMLSKNNTVAPVPLLTVLLSSPTITPSI